MLRTIRASAFACTASWCVAAVAQTKDAALSPHWPTRISNCAAELTSALPSVIQLEVDVLLREQGSASPPENVAIQCDGDSARITVSLHGTTRETTVDLSELAAQHRARSLALATAELLHSLANRDDGSAQPAVAPARQTPASETPPPSPPQETPSSPQRKSSPPALLVGALAEWLGQPATPLFGARIVLRYPLSAVVVPALSADASFGSASLSSARVGAKTLSAATHLYLEASALNLRWSAGPGVRIGWAELVGHPSDESMFEGRALSGAWGGPEVRSRLAYGTSTTHSPLFAFELGVGVITLPMRGLLDGAEPVYALSGPWLSLCVEVGLEL